MDKPASRFYSVNEVRQIVTWLCDESNMSNEKLMGMICLADLLDHIEAENADDMKTQVQAFCHVGGPKQTQN